MHSCLNMTGGAGWMKGAIYIQNLIHTIGFPPEEERKGIKLSVPRLFLAYFSAIPPLRQCD
jgi:hypothetical protein